jgi:dynactin 4
MQKQNYTFAMATGSLASYGFPYCYISCSCAEEGLVEENESSRVDPADDGEIETEHTFNPRDPRANYALYPLEHLMWCEDCRDIRCSRCTTEEVACWYCPSCMFEVASGMVKSEGNR